MVDAARSVSLWLAGVMALAVLAMQAVPVLAPAIASAAGLPPAFVGAWTAAAWGAALAGTLAAPALLARRSAWHVAQACLLLCLLGLLAVTTGHTAGLVLGVLLIGAAQGLEGPMASHLLAAYVPPARRPLWFSVKQTGVQVGAVAASFVLPAVAVLAGWRVATALAALAVGGLLLALQVPGRHWAVNRVQAARPGRGTFTLLREHRALRWLALAAAAFGATQIVLNGFFVTYAVAERGASLVAAGAWLGAAQAGGLVGRLFWGWLAARLGTIVPLLAVLGLAMSACSLWLGRYGPGWWLLPLFGLSASGWNGIFLAEVAHRVPPEEAGTATAAVLVLLTAGLVAGPLLFSALGAATSFGHAFTWWAGVGLLGTAALWQAQRATRS